MSRFFKALEQAERERALARPAATVRPEMSPAPPLPAEPVDVGAPSHVPPPPAASTSARRDVAPARRPAPAATPPGIDPHLVSLLEPGTLQAEPYRALRHLIEQRRQLTGLGVLVVTSPGIGDGKTTTTINLAGALAQDPKARVLLIDGDLRNPALAARLGMNTGRHDLVDAILDDGIGLDAVVQPCPPFNLDLLPANRHQGVPYEILASPRFSELIDEARRRYAHVLIDSPPLVPFPDGRILSGSADGYLLVVSANQTPRKLVEEALALIDPAKLVGLVFNGDDRPIARYYDYYPGRGAAARAAGENGHAGRGWLGSVLPWRDRGPARGRRS